jgi:hypothetical protein
MQEGQRNTGGLAGAGWRLQNRIPAIAQGTAHVIKNSGYRKRIQLR